MNKHTPGPWEALKNNYGQVLIVVRSTQDFVCAVPDECEADAKLISAAPDLLEALKLARRICNNLIGHPDDPYGKLIDAAIKKAEAA
jgi:hypothetical protein